MLDLVLEIFRSFAGIVRSRKGQSMVETALVAPMLIGLVILVGDMGRAFYYREAVTNAARQALRVAVQSDQQATGNTYCNSNNVLGKALVLANLPDTNSDAIATIVNTSALEATTDGTSGGSVLKNTPATTMTVTWHCNGSSAYTLASETTTDPGLVTTASITVHVDYTFQMITPFANNVLGTQTLHITADETGRAEY